jgi:hypothetical protein
LFKPLLLIFALIAASQLEVFASGGLVGAHVEAPHSHPPSDEEIRRIYQIEGMVFKENLHPTRTTILAFAAHLKEKYKVLFAL